MRDADRIMVLGEGDQGLGGGTKIREQGTHDELMAKKGIYFALVGSQGEPKGDGTLSTEIVDAADADGVEAKVASSSALRSLSAVSSVHSDGSSKPAGGKLKRSEDAATDTGKNDTLDAATARDKAERKNLYKVSTSRVWKFARGANRFIVLATICGESASLDICFVFVVEFLRNPGPRFVVAALCGGDAERSAAADSSLSVY